jgi:hypothetical protein
MPTRLPTRLFPHAGRRGQQKRVRARQHAQGRAPEGAAAHHHRQPALAAPHPGRAAAAQGQSLGTWRPAVRRAREYCLACCDAYPPLPFALSVAGRGRARYIPPVTLPLSLPIPRRKTMPSRRSGGSRSRASRARPRARATPPTMVPTARRGGGRPRPPSPWPLPRAPTKTKKGRAGRRPAGATARKCPFTKVKVAPKPCARAVLVFCCLVYFA